MRQVIRMRFEEACGKAMAYFRKEHNDIGLSSIMDLGDRWLFSGVNAEPGVVYGKQKITINKKTGDIELFYLTNEKNFKLLDNAVDIAIAEEYVVM